MDYKLKHITSATQIQRYAGVTAIMVESALPLTVVGILYAVFYAKGSLVALALGDIWGSLIVSHHIQLGVDLCALIFITGANSSTYYSSTFNGIYPVEEYNGNRPNSAFRCTADDAPY